jgi:hypothetical protein
MTNPSGRKVITGERKKEEEENKDCETHYRGKGLILFAGINQLLKIHFAPKSS